METLLFGLEMKFITRNVNYCVCKVYLILINYEYIGKGILISLVLV